MYQITELDYGGLVLPMFSWCDCSYHIWWRPSECVPVASSFEIQSLGHPPDSPHNLHCNLWPDNTYFLLTEADGLLALARQALCKMWQDWRHAVAIVHRMQKQLANLVKQYGACVVLTSTSDECHEAVEQLKVLLASRDVAISGVEDAYYNLHQNFVSWQTVRRKAGVNRHGVFVLGLQEDWYGHFKEFWLSLEHAHSKHSTVKLNHC